MQPGDSVKWTTNTQFSNEIHTVTFPDAATVANPGPVNATNPLPFVCENGVLADTVAPGGPPPTPPRVRESELVLCHVCGDIMQRAGSCHACPSCGATSGCS